MTSLAHYCNRIFAFNSRLPRSGNLWGFAINQRPIDDGEWQQITPYGDFPNKVGLQRVTREAAERMVEAFNALPGRNGARFQGLSIFFGHPDVVPGKYPDKRRIGRILELDGAASQATVSRATLSRSSMVLQYTRACRVLTSSFGSAPTAKGDRISLASWSLCSIGRVSAHRRAMISKSGFSRKMVR